MSQSLVGDDAIRRWRDQKAIRNQEKALERAMIFMKAKQHEMWANYPLWKPTWEDVGYVEYLTTNLPGVHDA